MPSTQLATTLAIIAAKAARYKRFHFELEACAEFAWFSIGQDGDASTDDVDFQRHVALWIELDQREHTQLQLRVQAELKRAEAKALLDEADQIERSIR